MFEKIILFLGILIFWVLAVLMMIWLFIEVKENKDKEIFCKENFLHKPASEVPMWCVKYLK